MKQAAPGKAQTTTTKTKRERESDSQVKRRRRGTKRKKRDAAEDHDKRAEVAEVEEAEGEGSDGGDSVPELIPADTEEDRHPFPKFLPSWQKRMFDRMQRAQRQRASRIRRQLRVCVSEV
eukprot:TRINITY_DN6174_c0_g1_i1.p1 TRINITY_DN6174_c0_g1~~TRINITY_DN6174_c0_g1_i1.p1  ORF type:complete len:120 (+),score=22.73 TRINITY_DN6174_c0_g1_i1:66-425(+)